MPWLRSLVTGLSPRKPGFVPGSIHVGFVVDKVAVGQVFYCHQYIITPSLSKLISGECGNVSRHPRFGLDPPHLQEEKGGKKASLYIL
jgi:hypothetical protein